jgi:hypothetical protein
LDRSIAASICIWICYCRHSQELMPAGSSTPSVSP